MTCLERLRRAFDALRGRQPPTPAEICDTLFHKAVQRTTARLNESRLSLRALETKICEEVRDQNIRLARSRVPRVILNRKAIRINEKLLRSFAQIQGSGVIQLFHRGRAWTPRERRAIAIIIYVANRKLTPELVAIRDHIGDNFGTTGHAFAWENNLVPNRVTEWFDYRNPTTGQTQTLLCDICRRNGFEDWHAIPPNLDQQLMNANQYLGLD